jgi:hypothetical protein
MKRSAAIAILGLAAWVLSGTALAEHNNTPQTITVPKYSHTAIKVSKVSHPIKVSTKSHPIKVSNRSHPITVAKPKHPKAARN